jgi:hypothetical protein
LIGDVWDACRINPIPGAYGQFGDSCIPSLIIKILTNNITAIKKLTNTRTLNQYREPEVDIELQIMEETKRLDDESMKVTISYVQSYGNSKSKKT